MMKVYFDKIKRIRNSFFNLSRKDKIILDLQRQLSDVVKKFDILAKATNDAVRDWDLQTNDVTWNHGLKTIYGYAEGNDKHNISKWMNNIHPSDKDEVLKIINDAIDKSKVNWNAIYRYRCANGSYKYTYDRSYIVYDGTRATRMVGAMQDINERMTTLEEVEKLSLVASVTENLVIITDADQKIEWVNDGFVKRTGYSLHEIMGKTPRILQGPETDRATLDRIRKNIEAAKSVTEEVLNYTKDGSKFWLKLNINPVFDEKNKLIRIIAVETDITPQKDYENKLTAVARELSDLIENANAIIFGLDINGCVNEWNNHVIAATGYAKNDVIGKKLTSFVIGQDKKQSVENLIKHVLNGNPVSLKEFQIINKNGGSDILLLSATPRKNASGEIIGLMAVGQDITELTQYRASLEEKVNERTKALEMSLAKEKELVDLKSKFVSVASHEFRTPLSTISLVTGLLRKYREKLSPEEFDVKLDSVEKQVLHMTSLLDDILTIGKNEAGKIITKHTPIFISEFFFQTAREVEQSAGKQGINVTVNCANPKICTDENLLRKILINLLVNAIKFSDQPVDLTVTDTTDTLSFEVSDNGIGITPQDMEAIFIPFQRGVNVGIRPGTGLGLSIVKRSVELLNGEIKVSNRIAGGTVFTVLLPLNL